MSDMPEKVEIMEKNLPEGEKGPETPWKHSLLVC